MPVQQPPASPNLPHHERIEDPIFRRAVDLLDAGDATTLRTHLAAHPTLTRQHVVFEDDNYFRNPTLLAFIAENPIRHGTLPPNIVAVALVILEAGVDTTALNETLGLVATGRIPRESHVQIPLIDLLCDHGADPATAIEAAAHHGESAAVQALLARGAALTLPVAAALDRTEDVLTLLPLASPETRHLTLALASQFGRIEAVSLLLTTGEDPNRYNPFGAHAHSTPLHQAAHAGQAEVVQLLLAHGADPNLRDTFWQGTPADWAHHGGHPDLEAQLRSLET